MLPEQPEQHAADGLTIANEEAASSMRPSLSFTIWSPLQIFFPYR